ncbi:hypothetical protein PR001_g22983 [Phytophthora rubi]|uniref:Uncharacterized protein n=1 Tax=Phytophthora rubi TaxID=129364 RepID=A0A6A3HN28_9STRA|nr:hypothetical protein PR002_g26700 [Phytophthora rubi]KAE8985130.1 hypothetical protein PR001_g22983 [Phytophthora rubi]
MSVLCTSGFLVVSSPAARRQQDYVGNCMVRIIGGGEDEGCVSRSDNDGHTVVSVSIGCMYLCDVPIH